MKANLLEILTDNKANLSANIHKLDISLIGNITLNPLRDILKYYLNKKNLDSNINYGDYNSIVSDSIKYKNSDLIIIFWEFLNLSDSFSLDYSMLEDEVIDGLIEKTKNAIKLTIDELKDSKLVIFNSFSRAYFAQTPILDKFKQVVDELNSFLHSNVTGNMRIIELDSIISKIGHKNTFNHRAYYNSKSLYKFDFYSDYVERTLPIIGANFGRLKKLLILDCDNTLWGGIVGEDGVAGIKIDRSDSLGRIFYEVQQIIKSLEKKGVILAICSKNNEEDVLEVFSKRKDDMPLQLDKFVAYRINWNNKATNIRDIANELNIGLDSVVFLDDSDFEVGLISSELPMVKVFTVPKDLSGYPALAWEVASNFYSESVSDEDKSKTKKYLDNKKREDLADDYGNYEDYLKSLGLKIKVQWGENVNIQRASQMSQKTNQFNLTTIRFSEEEITRLASSDAHRILTYSLEDSVGDYGVIGLIILSLDVENQIKSATIDAFLMSCRAIGRNVEKKIFQVLVDVLKDAGFKYIYSRYLKTEKNMQVSEFYDLLGFEVINKTEMEHIYQMNLDKYVPLEISYIEALDD
jgi:FkbH-like protein